MLKGRTQSTVEAVFEEHFALPTDDVGKQIAEVGGVLIEQRGEVEFLLRRGEVVETYLGGSDGGPLSLGEVVVRVRTAVPDAAEDHADSLGGQRHGSA